MTLLPPNASALERAIDAAGAARFPLPTSLAGASWNPATCPASLLGYLAYQLSIDLWVDSWPELKKRQVCADALRLHRLKTTIAGIRAHVAIAGASIAKVVRPPSRIFATSGMTAAEREAWLETLPQLRLYPFDTRPLGSRRVFASGYAGLRFYARCYPRPSRGVELTGTRATIWDRGVERPITLEPVGADAIRLVVPRTTPRPFLGHAYWRRLYAERSAAAGNTVTLQLSGDIAGFAVAAGLDPIEIEPTRVAQGRTAPRARAYAGHAFGRRWLQPSAAPRLVYDRVSLADPTRVAARRHGRLFAGHARLGFPAFRAELTLDVPLVRSRQRAARFAGMGFLKGADLAPVARAIEAISVSKAARDTILVSTATHRAVAFGQGLRFGTFRFGEIRKAA